ncbi:MAG: hypothetical protein KAG84_00175 [Bacteroidales bacterium]|nr:hypothetical protein [Bacteroidales bacterium]
MRNFTINFRNVVLVLVLIFIGSSAFAQSTDKKSIAVINIDAQGIEINMALMTSLVTLELERLNKFEVIDKYDVSNIMNNNKFPLDKPYGKTDLISIGKLVNVDKVISGSVEKFGNKLIVVLRLIDITSAKIEKVDVMEYLDQEEDIQVMVRISLHNIFDISNDKNTVDMLSNVNVPLANTKNRVNLSGPRFGLAATVGKAGERLRAPKNNGGYNLFPINSTIGYQFEVQYVASGQFQALFETILTLSAVESSYLIPSVSIINGFRFNKMGFEFGIGPVFRIVQTAQGYYNESGEWIYEGDILPGEYNGDYIHQIDSRGDYKLGTGLIVAVGYTFKSGHINFPVNFYISPSKDGTVMGLMFGFNVARSKKKSKNKIVF